MSESDKFNISREEQIKLIETMEERHRQYLLKWLKDNRIRLILHRFKNDRT